MEGYRDKKKSPETSKKNNHSPSPDHSNQMLQVFQISNFNNTIKTNHIGTGERNSQSSLLNDKRPSHQASRNKKFLVQHNSDCTDIMFDSEFKLNGRQLQAKKLNTKTGPRKQSRESSQARIMSPKHKKLSVTPIIKPKR